METIVNAAATLCSSPNCFFQLKPTYKQPLKVPAVCCLRKNEKGNGLISGPSPIELEDNNNVEMHQDSFQSSNRGLEINRSDIWNLFREAQRNILYLNKQRLMAIEELKQTQQEKQLLLNRMEQLGGGKQSSIGKGPLTKSDKQSICSELLLRIDSMVLTGMIDTGEASVLRRLVIDNKVSIVEVFSEIRQKGDAELLAGFGQFKDKSNRDRFHIVHICTEMEPVASVGSLASYVTSLSHALQRKGNLVEVILPKYASMNLNEIEALQNIEAEFHSYFNGHWHGNRIWTGVVNGIGVTFIEPLYYSAFFNREAIYGYSDDFERFTYFSRASLDYIVKSGKQPDVLHIHNWETAIVGPLFWDIFVNKGLSGTRILFTCHGFSSQCLEHPNKLALCGLDPSQLHRPDRLQDNIKKHLVNILKGGVVYSNKVIMMSSIHSKGKIIRNLSHGLESTLAIHKEKLSIAPYGFDGNIWDPSKDKFLPANYSAEDIKGKTICKVALLQRLGLSGQAGTVVVGCIYTKVSDTDLENLKAAVWLGSKKGAQFIFMGAGEIPSINAALDSFQKELKDENVRFINKYDEALSHLILAGSDIFLCPSFHDPVLQMPLKAIKYGAAPVAITLTDDGFRHAMEHDFEGTRSSQYIISAFGNMSLSQALGQINKDPTHWNQKIRDGMAKDFSWDAECRDVHLEAYTSIKNL